MNDLIDPKVVCNYARSDRELDTFWLFCICVAGKNADQTALKVGRLIENVPDDWRLFEWLSALPDLMGHLQNVKVGQYARISRAIRDSAFLDLRNATLEQLEQVHGVGPKTARFFLLNTRPGVEYAVLDTHILRWLREQHSCRAPKSTPPKGKTYEYWEDVALNFIRGTYPGLTLAEADLLIWATMSGRLEA